MKTTIFSIILFLALSATIILNAIFISDTRRYLIDAAEDIKSAYRRDERIEELERFWKSRRGTAGLSVSDVILDQTANIIICIKCANEAENEAEIQKYCTLLADSADNIGRNERLSIDNLF